MPLPIGTIELIMHQFIGVIGKTVYLLQYDTPFFFNVIQIEKRVEQHVGQQIDGLRQLPTFNFGQITTVFLAGKRIKRPAHCVDLLGNGQGAMSQRTLEEHVLDKVGDTVFSRSFMPGPILDPKTDGRGIGPGDGLGQNADTVIENGFFNHVSRARNIIENYSSSENT